MNKKLKERARQKTYSTAEYLKSKAERIIREKEKQLQRWNQIIEGVCFHENRGRKAENKSMEGTVCYLVCTRQDEEEQN